MDQDIEHTYEVLGSTTQEEIRQLTEEKIFLGQQLQEARKEIWRLQSKIRREAAWREGVCHDEAPP